MRVLTTLGIEAALSLFGAALAVQLAWANGAECSTEIGGKNQRLNRSASGRLPSLVA